MKLLESDRLFMRELLPGDMSQTYFHWMRDPEVIQYLEVRFRHPSWTEMVDFIEHHRKRDDSFLLGIYLKGTDIHIGNVKLSLINWTHGYGDLSYFIGEREYWGQGYATEAVKRVSDWALSDLGLFRVEAGAQKSHVATRRVLTKAGFICENFDALPKMLNPLTGEHEPQLIYARVRT